MADLMGSGSEIAVAVDGQGSPRPVIRLTGELDTLSAQSLGAVVHELSVEAPEQIVFDLTELTFMDSSGLALLLMARQAAPVELRGLSTALRRVIEASGLAGVFQEPASGEEGTHRFSAEPASVSAARRFVAEHLVGMPADVVDTVAVMVSELATNAVQHCRTDFDLSLRIDRDRLRVEVADAGGGRPEVREPSADELRGRGLQIVRSLSDDWGVLPRPFGLPGKVVWFEMEVPSA